MLPQQFCLLVLLWAGRVSSCYPPLLAGTETEQERALWWWFIVGKKRRRCKHVCAILQAGRANFFASVRAKQNKLSTSTDPGICILATCNLKSAFSRAILPHCLYYLVTRFCAIFCSIYLSLLFLTLFPTMCWWCPEQPLIPIRHLA